MIMDKKKAAQLIVGRMGEAGEAKASAPMKPEMDLDEGGDALTSIAEELLMAVKDGSAHGVKEALKAFMAECEVSPESDYE